MAIVASAHVLLAGPLLPAVPSVVRVIEPPPVSGMEEVAETTVVPVAVDVMTTVQHAAELQPVRLHVDEPAPEQPAPLMIPAVAVPSPSFVPTAVTVMLSL